MRRTMLTVMAAAALTLATVGVAEAGCYRFGETGYHWYRFCIGPGFLYPHHRHCEWRHHERFCYVD